jgi:t-SNARE complex subunit (syntaxin)
MDNNSQQIETAFKGIKESGKQLNRALKQARRSRIIYRIIFWLAVVTVIGSIIAKIVKVN